MAVCPECEAEIDLKNPIKGEIVQCPDCGVELEVVLPPPSSWLRLPKKKRTGASSSAPSTCGNDALTASPAGHYLCNKTAAREDA